MTLRSRRGGNRLFSPALHGLRGIAVSYVVVSHLGNAELFLLPVRHNAIGKVGVWIFFVLSAFLLTKNLHHDFEFTSSRLTSTFQYAVHRFFRIYPLFGVVIILHVFRGHFTPVEALHHLLLRQGWGELWAIPVEFQYYLLVPFVVIIASQFSKGWAGWILFVLCVVSFFYGLISPESVFANGLNIFPKLTPFLLGSMFAFGLLKANVAFLARSFFVNATAILCLSGLLVATLMYRHMGLGALSSLYAPWLSVGISLAVIGLIHTTQKSPFFNRVFSIRPLVFLGEISFSLYLLHMFVIDGFKNVTLLPVGVRAWGSLAISILLATVSYRLIEKPGIRIGKKIAQSLGHSSGIA